MTDSTKTKTQLSDELAQLRETIQNLRHEISDREQREAKLVADRASLNQRLEERTKELQLINAEMVRAAHAKDEFLANMSHELRTPLNSILGMAEVLRENIYGTLNPDQQRALSYIEEGGQHLLNLINDILDLAKIEAGKFDLDIQPVSVFDLCEICLHFVQQMARKKQVKIFSTFDSEAETLHADERRLKQILINLLSNAVKFTPEGGRVGLKVNGNNRHQIIHFTVWDTGTGIPEQEIERLFYPFEQLKSNQQHAGTGLGLPLVSRLVELHGGGVAVETEVGQGSRFTISLPWQPVGSNGYTTEHPFHPTPSLPRSQQSGAHILLAEDNQLNSKFMTDYLQATGYRLINAKNGAEAIEKSRTFSPNLIIMDIQMPVVNGLQAMERIRADAELAHIPIIALTALVMPGDRERCLAAGANEYLSKPVSLFYLVDVIERLLQA